MKTFRVRVSLGNALNPIVIDQTEYTFSDEQIEVIVGESSRMFALPGEYVWFGAYLSMGIWGLYNGHPPRHDDDDVVCNPYAIAAAVIAQNHRAYWETAIRTPGTGILLYGIEPLKITPITENLNIRCECTYT